MTVHLNQRREPCKVLEEEHSQQKAARAPMSMKQEEVWSVGRKAESIMPGSPGSDGLLMCGALRLQTYLIHRLCLDRLKQAPLTYWPTFTVAVSSLHKIPSTGSACQIQIATTLPSSESHTFSHQWPRGSQRPLCVERAFLPPPPPRGGGEGNSLCLSARHCSHRGGCSVLKPFRAALGNL